MRSNTRGGGGGRVNLDPIGSVNVLTMTHATTRTGFPHNFLNINNKSSKSQN